MAGTSPLPFADVEITRLTRAELPVDSTDLARFLIGKAVVRDLPEGRMAGRIVETEAYLHGDAAAHSFIGETPRNRSLFGERGHAYVYVAYGIHRMLNVVGGIPGVGTGVLIRAAEPLEGIALMEARRGSTDLTDLARGPGKLAQAFEITMGLTDTDMTADGPLWLGRIDRPAGEIGVSIRIGITKDADRPLRFYERGSRFVSGRKGLNI
ncbi:MAG TPA: DNA-3-methyladenine glycosylase [Alphaproteobacteria bacterium]|jgi:DNA-3-methyladenine glycosylase|nr:DNA-3-methyladenine glycosylase [Alphaproteobacteria bacterium]